MKSMKGILLFQSTCFLATPLLYIYMVKKKESECCAHEKWYIPKHLLFVKHYPNGKVYYAEKKTEKWRDSFPYLAKETRLTGAISDFSEYFWRRRIQILKNPLLKGKIPEMGDCFICSCGGTDMGIIIEKRYRGNLSNL